MSDCFDDCDFVPYSVRSLYSSSERKEYGARLAKEKAEYNNNLIMETSTEWWIHEHKAGGKET